MKKPYLLEIEPIGRPEIGYISILEESGKLPFPIKRIFWTYYTPESIVRGRHAHYQTQQILIAVAGRIVVTTELPDGQIDTFILDSPNKAVVVPPNAWHTMQYSHTAVQLVLASTDFDENDYIRDYDQFKEIYSKK